MWRDGRSRELTVKLGEAAQTDEEVVASTAARRRRAEHGGLGLDVARR